MARPPSSVNQPPSEGATGSNRASFVRPHGALRSSRDPGTPSSTGHSPSSPSADGHADDRSREVTLGRLDHLFGSKDFEEEASHLRPEGLPGPIELRLRPAGQLFHDLLLEVTGGGQRRVPLARTRPRAMMLDSRSASRGMAAAYCASCQARGDREARAEGRDAEVDSRNPGPWNSSARARATRRTSPSGRPTR